MEQGPYRLPEVFFRLSFLPYRVEQLAAELLYLVNKKCQHHEHDKDGTQMLLAESIVVLKIIPLIFQGIECLILYLPAGATATHDLHGIILGQGEIRDPAKPFRLARLGVFLTILDEIYPQILIGLVQGNVIENTKAMKNMRVVIILDNKIRCFFPLGRTIDIIKEKLVISRLYSEDIVVAKLL